MVHHSTGYRAGHRSSPRTHSSGGGSKPTSDAERRANIERALEGARKAKAEESARARGGTTGYSPAYERAALGLKEGESVITSGGKPVTVEEAGQRFVLVRGTRVQPTQKRAIIKSLLTRQGKKVTETERGDIVTEEGGRKVVITKEGDIAKVPAGAIVRGGFVRSGITIPAARARAVAQMEEAIERRRAAEIPQIISGQSIRLTQPQPDIRIVSKRQAEKDIERMAEEGKIRLPTTIEEQKLMDAGRRQREFLQPMFKKAEGFASYLTGGGAKFKPGKGLTYTFEGGTPRTERTWMGQFAQGAIASAGALPYALSKVAWFTPQTLYFATKEYSVGGPKYKEAVTSGFKGAAKETLPVYDITTPEGALTWTFALGGGLLKTAGTPIGQRVLPRITAETVKIDTVPKVEVLKGTRYTKALEYVEVPKDVSPVRVPPSATTKLRTLGVERAGRAIPLATYTTEGVKFFKPTVKQSIPLETLAKPIAAPRTAVGTKALTEQLALTAAEKTRIQTSQAIIRELGLHKGMTVKDVVFKLETLKRPETSSAIIEGMIARNKGVVFGSTTMEMLPKGYRLTPGDIDIMFPKRSEAQLVPEVAKLAENLQRAGENVEVSPQNPLVIQAKPKVLGQMGEKVLEVKAGTGKITEFSGSDIAPAGGLGFDFPDIKAGQFGRTVPFGRARAITAGEQLTRKGVASAFFRGKDIRETPPEFQMGGVFPRGRRTKDIPGFIVSAQGLTAVMKQSPFAALKTRKIAAAETATRKYFETYTPEQQAKISSMIQEGGAYEVSFPVASPTTVLSTFGKLSPRDAVLPASQYVFYHGTKAGLVDDILKKGLKPTGETGIVSTEAYPFGRDRVFLTDTPSEARFFAGSGGKVLKVRLTKDQLRSADIGGGGFEVAVKGKISPSQIKQYKSPSFATSPALSAKIGISPKVSPRPSVSPKVSPRPSLFPRPSPVPSPITKPSPLPSPIPSPRPSISPRPSPVPSPKPVPSPASYFFGKPGPSPVPSPRPRVPGLPPPPTTPGGPFKFGMDKKPLAAYLKTKQWNVDAQVENFLEKLRKNVYRPSVMSNELTDSVPRRPASSINYYPPRSVRASSMPLMGSMTAPAVPMPTVYPSFPVRGMKREMTGRERTQGAVNRLMSHGKTNQQLGNIFGGMKSNKKLKNLI